MSDSFILFLAGIVFIETIVQIAEFFWIKCLTYRD